MAGLLIFMILLPFKHGGRAGKLRGMKAPFFGVIAMGLTVVNSMAAPVNLLTADGLNHEEVLESLWAPVRNKEFVGDLTVETEGGKKSGGCLKIVTQDTGSSAAHRYGEWRFKEQIEVDHGVEYRFRMWVKGKVDAPAGAGVYVNIYGFDEQKNPKPLFIRQATISEGDWTELSGTFVVPRDIERVRIGVGVDQGTGWVAFDGLWFAPSSETPES